MAATPARPAQVMDALLTDPLNDGTDGLHGIRHCGGFAVAQHPADAAYPDIPTGALRHVAVDHVAAADDMAALLTRLVRQPPGKTRSIPDEVRFATVPSPTAREGRRAIEF